MHVYGPRDADLLLIAAQHGNEPDTTAILSSALRAVRPEDLTAAVILVANPDGLMDGTRVNHHGVDLNRNFPTSDWSADLVNTRWAPGYPYDVPTSPGVHAADQPETRALLDLIERMCPRVVVGFHTPLAWVDDPRAGVTAQWLASRTGLPLVGDAGYPTPGSLGTWCDEAGMAGVTFEFESEGGSELRARYLQTLADLLTGVAPLG